MFSSNFEDMLNSMECCQTLQDQFQTLITTLPYILHLVILKSIALEQQCNIGTSPNAEKTIRTL